jgi:hypothetical protein
MTTLILSALLSAIPSDPPVPVREFPPRPTTRETVGSETGFVGLRRLTSFPTARELDALLDSAQMLPEQRAYAKACVKAHLPVLQEAISTIMSTDGMRLMEYSASLAKATVHGSEQERLPMRDMKRLKQDGDSITERLQSAELSFLNEVAACMGTASDDESASASERAAALNMIEALQLRALRRYWEDDVPQSAKRSLVDVRMLVDRLRLPEGVRATCEPSLLAGERELPPLYRALSDADHSRSAKVSARLDQMQADGTFESGFEAAQREILMELPRAAGRITGVNRRTMEAIEQQLPAEQSRALRSAWRDAICPSLAQDPECDALADRLSSALVDAQGDAQTTTRLQEIDASWRQELEAWRTAALMRVCEWQDRSSAYDQGYGPQNFQAFISALTEERRALHQRWSDAISSARVPAAQ